MSRGRSSSHHDAAFLSQDPYGEATLPTSRDHYSSGMDQTASSLNDGLPLFNSHTLPPPQPSHFSSAHRNSVSISGQPVPTAPSHQLHPQYATSDLPTLNVGGFVARSASLGGARKRDPFAHRADDVESGLGYSEMDGYSAGNSPSYSRGRVQDGFAPPPNFVAPPPARNPRAASQSYAQNPMHSQQPLAASGSMQPPAPPQQQPYDSPSPSSAYDISGVPGPHRVSSNQMPQYSQSTIMSPASSGSGWLGSESPYQQQQPRRASAAAHSGSKVYLDTGRQSVTLSPDARPNSSSSQSQSSRQAYPMSPSSTPSRSDDIKPTHNGSRKASRSGFRSVKDLKDLKPVVNAQPIGRRADSDASGKFLSVR